MEGSKGQWKTSQRHVEPDRKKGTRKKQSGKIVSWRGKLFLSRRQPPQRKKQEEANIVDEIEVGRQKS